MKIIVIGLLVLLGFRASTVGKDTNGGVAGSVIGFFRAGVTNGGEGDPMYTTNAKVARVKNASGSQIVGPNIVLKVMAGDSYSIRVASGWKSSAATPNTGLGLVSALVNLFSNAAAPASGGKFTATELQNSTVVTNSINTFLGGQMPNAATMPQAGVSWILLDEQMKFVTGGFESVGVANSATIHIKPNLTINKNGYLYIYTSNETTNYDVFFDNLQVTHTRGRILEETHYYPFGLVMQGISSKSANITPNKFHYNGKEDQSKEFTDEKGLEWTDYGARMYDSQIGRFFTQDRFAEKYSFSSQYSYTKNDPIKFIDFNGDNVDVYEVLHNKEGKMTWEGLATLVGIMTDLSEITGLDVYYEDGNLKYNEGSSEGISSGARDYLKAIIDDSNETISLGLDNSKKMAKIGSTANKINLNSITMNRLLKGAEKAGLGRLTFGYGFQVLHETIHTVLGSTKYRELNKLPTSWNHPGSPTPLPLEPYMDTDKVGEIGETETIINSWRRQMKSNLATRDEYLWHANPAIKPGFDFMNFRVYSNNGSSPTSKVIEVEFESINEISNKPLRVIKF